LVSAFVIVMKPEKGALLFFQLALAARSEPRKRFGDKQPMNDHKNHFKKNSFPFYAHVQNYYKCMLHFRFKKLL